MSKIIKFLVIALNTINYNGKCYAPGKQIELDKESYKQLIGMKPLPIELVKKEEEEEDKPTVLSNKGTMLFKEHLLSLESMDSGTADALINAGFYTIEKIRKASKKELVAINGIGEITALKIMEELSNGG